MHKLKLAYGILLVLVLVVFYHRYFFKNKTINLTSAKPYN